MRNAIVQPTKRVRQQSPHQVEQQQSVTCDICGAIYTPSDLYQNILHAPPIFLESAFMSVCHFCFRCRRPACPDCWDPVHGVCGSCVQETQLALRTEVTPLPGIVFPPQQHSQDTSEEAKNSLLMCIRPGRFHTLSLTSRSVHESNQEQEKQAQPKQARQSSNHLDQVITDRIKTVVIKPPESIVKQISQRLPALRVQDSIRSSRQSIPRMTRLKGPLERILTIIALIVLLTIIALIITAEVSLVANAQIVRLLHVDIRAEIGYLWHLIGQMH